MQLPFRILNVFAIEGQRLSGNPLCVFEDGSSLSDQQMQALAQQMNLSETTFLLPPTAAGANRRVRIFTPSFEMPFAGHPTLGSAAVVHGSMPEAAASTVVLEMKAGLVPVTHRGGAWTLRAAQPPAVRAVTTPLGTVAAMVGLTEAALGGAPLWVSTGAEQLIVPLASAEAVRAARPEPSLLAEHGYSQVRGGSMVYVWAPLGDDEILARFFFLAHGAVLEDPATGSACANLGGWLLASQWAPPLRRVVWQGAQLGRPSRLELAVDGEGGIFVTGLVLELGRGSLTL